MTFGVCRKCKGYASTIIDGACVDCREEKPTVDIEVNLGVLQFMGDRKLIAFDTDNCIVAWGDDEDMLLDKFQTMVVAHVYTSLENDEKPFKGGHPLEDHRAEQFELSTDEEVRTFEFNVTTPIVSPRYKVTMYWRKAPLTKEE